MALSSSFTMRGCSRLALAVAALTLPIAAQAQDASTTAHTPIAIPAAKLTVMLSAIAHKGGVKVAFDHDRLAGIVGPAVNAGSEDEALRQVLVGTDLVAALGQDGIWHVTAPETGEITVRAHRDEAELGYDVNRPSSSSRDGEDLRDQPQATTVVTGKLMADEQVQNLYEAMENVGGATIDTGNVQGAATFNVRGFLVTPLTDGLSDPAAIAAPVAGVDRIEVLKGPAAILAGADNLGGAVNIVMKKPFAAPLLNISAEVGSYGDYKVTVDGSSALDADKKFSARLIAEYESANHNYAGYNGRDEKYVSPMIRYFDGPTDFTLALAASDVRQAMTPYAAFSETGVLYDLNKAPVGQASQGFRVQNLDLSYDFKHDFGKSLSLISRGHRSASDINLDVYALGGDYGAVQLFLGTNELQKTVTYADDTYLRARFSTFGIKQVISAGMNYSKNTMDDYVNNTFNNEDSVQIIPGFFASPYNQTFPTMPRPEDYNYTAISKQFGFYAQDYLEYGRLHVLAAVRHTDFTSQTLLVDKTPGAKYKPSATTPNIGAVVDIFKSLSVYANYMRGFVPQFLFDADDNLLPPERSRNVEAGLKLTLPAKISATLSAYNLEQTNTPLYVSYNVYTVTKGERSKGIELDVSANPLKGWDLTGSFSYATYAWLDPTTTVAVVTGQPKEHVSLFSRYTLQNGALKNLGGSIGVFANSSSYAGTVGKDRIPGGTRIDTHVYYKFGPISANFGIDNLFDKKLYGVATSSTYIPIEDPRTFRLTLTYAMF